MKSKEELKKLFENGDKPTQEDFWEWQDSYWHKNEKLSVENIDYDFFQKKDLTDKALNVTSQEFLDEGIATQEDFNIDTREKLNSKLNKPYAEGTIQQYSKFLGLDNNGNTVALPTEDLEKNLANSSLTSTAGSGLTLGADWAVETLGHQYSISGLSDVSADQEFNTFISQNASGKLGKTNGIQPFLNLPNSLSEQEKTKWKTAMNGGWTTNTMSVATITPPVVDKQDKNYWVTLRGANLNLNPASFSVDLMANDGTTLVANIPGSQVQLYTNGIDLTFYFNYKDFPLGNYKVRLWNGVAYYTTTSTISIVQNLQVVDVSSLTWMKKIYNDAVNDNTFGSGGAAIYQSSASVKAYSTGDPTIVGALKSSKINNVGDNFYLEFAVNFQHASNLTTTTQYVGLMNNNAAVELLDQTLTRIKIVGNIGSSTGYRNYYLNDWRVGSNGAGSPGGSNETINVVVIKQGTSMTIAVTARNVTTQAVISVPDIEYSLNMAVNNMGGSTTTSLTVVNLYKF